MAHTLQDRYSALVDAKLRAINVTDNIVNTNYEGQPKAGAVKIPVRDTEVATATYSKTTGAALTYGSTTYITATISNDIAVNELVDGYEAAAVPDNLVADRLDSAAYALASVMEAAAISELESNATLLDTATLTAKTVYPAIVAARTALSKAKVPTDRRWLLVSPDVYALLLQDVDHFIRSTGVGDDAVVNGSVGKVAGFTVYECVNLDTHTNFVCGHPDWFCKVDEWSVPVSVADLKDGAHIGASAVQGRKIFEYKLTKAATAGIHKN